MTPSAAIVSRRRALAGGAALAAAAALPRSASAQDNPYGIQGRLAPEIALDYWIDAHGEPGHFSVLENRGKWVFLKCFQNWCPGCHSSGFPTLKKFSDAFADHPKVAIAGIQTAFEGRLINTQGAIRRLQMRYQLPITMGHDPGGGLGSGQRPTTMLKYRTGGTPWLILVQPDGRVAYNNYHADPERLIAFVRDQVG